MNTINATTLESFASSLDKILGFKSELTNVAGSHINKHSSDFKADSIVTLPVLEIYRDKLLSIKGFESQDPESPIYANDDNDGHTLYLVWQAQSEDFIEIQIDTHTSSMALSSDTVD